MIFYGTRRIALDEPGLSELKTLLAGGSQDMDLDRAALTLATIEFPGLAVEGCLSLLDQHAEEVAARARDAQNGRDFVSAANQYLFGEFGLKGNTEDYYNPHNSCLNQVLTTRVGIPITLSVLYMEIARRLSKPVFGIGLPGHFVVKYDDGQYSTFIDAFNGGMLLRDDQCYDLAQMTVGDPKVLAPVDKRQILFRMVNNLRGIYFSRRSYAKALQIMDLLIEITPDLADQYKQRGLLYLQMQKMRAARLDMLRYLELAPAAEDREEMKQQLKLIERWLASLN